MHWPEQNNNKLGHKQETIITMATISTPALANHSLSWTQNRRAEQRIKPFAEIDLHGFTREDAIRRVTAFWESSSLAPKSRSNPWVCVITGTGAHSGALGGPGLKQAVHKLLVKRHMEFSWLDSEESCDHDRRKVE